MTKQDPTNADILAINDFDTNTEKRFQGIENCLGTIETKFTGFETKVTRIEVTMINKDYLDDKFGGDLVVWSQYE